jgi:hypothetical protein
VNLGDSESTIDLAEDFARSETTQSDQDVLDDSDPASSGDDEEEGNAEGKLRAPDIEDMGCFMSSSKAFSSLKKALNEVPYYKKWRNTRHETEKDPGLENRRVQHLTLTPARIQRSLRHMTQVLPTTYKMRG